MIRAIAAAVLVWGVVAGWLLSPWLTLACGLVLSLWISLLRDREEQDGRR